MKLVKSLWQGDVSLAITFWVFGVIGAWFFTLVWVIFDTFGGIEEIPQSETGFLVNSLVVSFFSFGGDTRLLYV